MPSPQACIAGTCLVQETGLCKKMQVEGKSEIIVIGHAWQHIFGGPKTAIS
jgi:hypothetical protein